MMTRWCVPEDAAVRSLFCGILKRDRMGPFVMKYWSGDEVVLSLAFFMTGVDVIIVVASSVLPKADEITSSRMVVDSDMMLMKVIFCSEILVESIFSFAFV